MKLAIIGTGNVARHNYLPFLAKQADVTLAYYNRNREKADACAVTFGGRVAGSIRELLADGPDAVLVLSSEQARRELALEALKHRPKRIFFEKPLIAEHGQDHVTEDDFQRGCELLAAAEAAETETAMVFNYRFFDQVLTARRLIVERALGAPLLSTALVHRACWSHCIDLLALLAGPAVRIAAPLAPGASADGSRSECASYVTAEGAVATIIRSGGQHFFHPLYELIIGFEHGRLHLRGLDGELELTDYRTTGQERFSPGRDGSQWGHYERSFERSLAAYLDSIRSGSPAPIPGIAGLRELQFEAGLARSARTGTTCDVTRDFPLTSA